MLNFEYLDWHVDGMVKLGISESEIQLMQHCILDQLSISEMVVGSKVMQSQR